MAKTKVSLEGLGEWDVFSPQTVYPPREDSLLLCRVLSEFDSDLGLKAFEIGCGSGIVTMVLATLGWEVSACDLNPFAVSATRGNMENNGIPGSQRISESGVGENLVLPLDHVDAVGDYEEEDLPKAPEMLSLIDDAGIIAMSESRIRAIVRKALISK